MADQTSGAVFRVIQKCVDQTAFFLGRVEQDFIYQICRQFFQQVDHIVESQFVDDIIDFVLCDAVDDFNLLVFADVSENLH